MAESSKAEIIEKCVLINSEELFDRMQPYYDLIDAAKKSVYGKFITQTDMSAKSLKQCISNEANAIDAVNENVCLGIAKMDVVNALRPLYKNFKRSLKENKDKPPFFHVNSLKTDSMFKNRLVSFAPPLLKFDRDSNMILCNDVIPMPGMREFIKGMEKVKSCKLSRITFFDVGEGIVDSEEYAVLTYIEIQFEVIGEKDE